MTDMLRVNVDGGKYTVIQDKDGKLFALRYGEPWRDLVGDNLVLKMAYQLEAALKLVEPLREAVLSAEADYKLAQRAADFHNNSDACAGGNYMEGPSWPRWYEAAQQAISDYDQEYTWQPKKRES